VSANFNRVLRCFRDDMSTPGYQAKVQTIADSVQLLAKVGLAVRQDFARNWENAHVLLELDKLVAGGAGSVLDFGGGNSPLCYTLAQAGLDVTVLDVDNTVAADVARGAAALGLEERLHGAVNANGSDWPVPDGAFDLALSVSVFEGILRSRRPHYWSEMRRVLAPGGSLLMTFDYGIGGRLVGDPPVSPTEVETDILDASGMTLIGGEFEVPAFDDVVGPPVKAVVPTVDGFDYRVAEYSFGAVHLRRD
jgi:SAM-dependent methyltransferase